MNALVPIALFGWVGVVLWLFANLPKREAVIWAFLTAWLFLPVVHEPVLGIRWTKMRATCYALLLAATLYDSERLLSFQPAWGDLPQAIWCLCPALSSLSNSLGPYDACSQALDQTITWGMPYLIGRVYLASFGGVRMLAVGILWSGLVYSPLCQAEIRMSPQFHTWLYGYFQHNFSQTIRFGGYRPVVFMDHGLAVGAWMTTASLIGVWLWRTKTLKTMRSPIGGYQIPVSAVAAIVCITNFMCKSSGAIGLGILGIMMLYLSNWSRLRIVMIAVMLIPGAYVYGRVWGGWTGMEFAEAIGGGFDRDRAASFIFRLENENLLIGRAMQSPIFGWGGWGRARVYDEDGKDITVTDGLWIIALGDRGLVGLFSMTMTMLLPGILFMYRYPPRLWNQPSYAPGAVLAVCLVLYAVDGLFNAMVNPVFMLLAGGLTGLQGTPLPAGPTEKTTAAPCQRPSRAQVKFLPRQENSLCEKP